MLFAVNKLPGVGLYILLLMLMTGCSLFRGSGGQVDQDVAFPPAAESPPTSESSLPKPLQISATETAENGDPTATISSPTFAPPTAVPPTNHPPPNPTAAQPAILSFSAVAVDNISGKTITFSWESRGGTSARIYNGANGSIRYPAYWDVSLNGSLTVSLPDTRRSNPQFDLYIYGDQNLTTYDTAAVGIEWPCSLEYFFDPNPAVCPAAYALDTPAVEQTFQGGRMIWLDELDWIYVLYDQIVTNGGPGGDLQWERYDDKWTDGDAGAERLPTPPDSYFPPVGRFALLWQENDTVQERLGWALAPEAAFEGAWQQQPSDTDNQGDGLTFMALENGRVARLSGFEVWGWLWLAVDPVN
jgi:hypothetical protein